MMTALTVKDVIAPLNNMGYEIKVMKPVGYNESLWQVYDESGRIFSGRYHDFLHFRHEELEGSEIVAGLVSSLSCTV